MKSKVKYLIIVTITVVYSLVSTCSIFALDASKPVTGDSGFGIYVILAIVSGILALGSCAFLILKRKSENR